jgi:hypothetical protein
VFGLANVVVFALWAWQCCRLCTWAWQCRCLCTLGLTMSLSLCLGLTMLSSLCLGLTMSSSLPFGLDIVVVSAFWAWCCRRHPFVESGFCVITSVFVARLLWNFNKKLSFLQIQGLDWMG